MPSAPSAPLAVPHSDLAEAVREATGSLGNNLNQVARAANRGVPVSTADLADIRALLAAIDTRLGTALEG